MDEIKIPKATARRLPLYYRYLILRKQFKLTVLQFVVIFLTLVPQVSVAMVMMLRTCLISLKRF